MAHTSAPTRNGRRERGYAAPMSKSRISAGAPGQLASPNNVFDVLASHDCASPSTPSLPDAHYEHVSPGTPEYSRRLTRALEDFDRLKQGRQHAEQRDVANRFAKQQAQLGIRLAAQAARRASMHGGPLEELLMGQEISRAGGELASRSARARLLVLSEIFDSAADMVTLAKCAEAAPSARASPSHHPMRLRKERFGTNAACMRARPVLAAPSPTVTFSPSAFRSTHRSSSSRDVALSESLTESACILSHLFREHGACMEHE